MNLTVLTGAPPLILFHLAAALGALAVGALVLWRRKGTPAHVLTGRIWVGLMIAAAGSAIFISEDPVLGPFSWLHLFVVATAFGLYQGLSHIRRGDVAGHASAMVSLFALALIGAGAFTLTPGRRIPTALFGPAAGWGLSLLIMAPALVGAALILGWGRRKAVALAQRAKRSTARAG